MHGACFALHKVLVLHCDKQCKVFYHLSCLLIAEFIFTAYFVGGGALLSVHVLHAHIQAGWQQQEVLRYLRITNI